MNILRGYIELEGETMGLHNEKWAEEEFGGTEIGDERRTRRLIELAGERANRPSASIAESCGDAGATKAAYRFYDNEEIDADTILGSHRRATEKRMAQESVVLAVQDTSYLNYPRPSTSGLSIIQENVQGLILHTTMAVTPERVPLGILDVQYLMRKEREEGKAEIRKELAIEDKESAKWLRSNEAVRDIQSRNPNVRIVSVGDREADIYDFFKEGIEQKQEVLVRAAWDRRVAHPEGHLWEYMENQAVVGGMKITVPRQKGKAARKAKIDVRFAKVTIQPPQNRSREGLPTITVNAVYARERKAKKDGIEWLLLTTSPVETYEEACEKIKWYGCRWVIEIYHKVLKSGCRVEERQFEEADRIKRYLAIDMPVAWRVLYLTMVGREIPDMPCTAIFEACEWQALYGFVHETKKIRKQTPTLKEVRHWIGKLGGFLGRKYDGEPGVIVMWEGLQRLNDIVRSWIIFSSPKVKCG